MDEPTQRLARGDKTAFAELYDLVADRLHHYLVVRLGNRDDADDVLQETFLRVVRWRDRLARVENLRAFVFHIARNEALRLGGRRKPTETASNLDQFVESDGPDVAARETAELVATGLARLTEEQREVVVLKHYSGMTFREIGEVTDVPAATAATRYRSALDRLRLWMKRQPT
jgi:RNA polymerase sigma-70 factor (ECF subfamily)